MEKSISDQIFEALGSSPEPLKQMEAVLNVSRDIAEKIRYVSTGNGACQPVAEKGDADHVL